MKRAYFLVSLFLFCSTFLFSQQYKIIGRVISAEDKSPIKEALIRVNEKEVVTQEDGSFTISSLSKGTYILEFKKEGYITKELTLSLTEDTDIGSWEMLATRENATLSVFTIDLEIDQDEDWDRDQIGGILSSQKDVFLNALSFQFSPTFFKARGLDSKYISVLFNGVLINNPLTGRAQWNSWGGLNDFINPSTSISFGLKENEKIYGGLASTTNIMIRPSLLRKQTKISQSFSNSSYTYASMISHSSTLKNNWDIAFLVSKRGGEGYVQGTIYDAASFFFAVEKNWNSKASSWVSIFYTPFWRGKNAPITQEVFSIKGKRYNPYWGFQGGKIRNERLSFSSLPTLVFNHEQRINSKSVLSVALSFQQGKSGNSRLNFNGSKREEMSIIGGGDNPSPIYYQKLPSYFLRDNTNLDYKNAYLAEKILRTDGQINWNALYNTNSSQEDYTVYAMYNDVDDSQRILGSVNYEYLFSPSLQLNVNTHFTIGKNEYFAEMSDLLGGKNFWDYNIYASSIEESQNNLMRPDNAVQENEKFQYHYAINHESLKANAMLLYKKNTFSSFIYLNTNYTSYLREGFFQNGNFPDTSFGKGQKLEFLSPQLRAGMTYLITPKHHVSVNGDYSLLPPSARDIYPNVRENNQPFYPLKNEQTYSFSLEYKFLLDTFQAFIRPYFSFQKDITELSFYFADGIQGENAFFVQEILSDMKKEHIGMESSIQFQVTPEFKLTGVATISRHSFANNPMLTLVTENNRETTEIGFVNGQKNFGSTFLKGYRLPTGPQQAYSLGMEYRDPAYWWLSIVGNYFRNSYIDVNPLLRTTNFYKDSNGFPFVEYDEEIAKSLLAQEAFRPYFLINLTCGKSWLLKRGTYLGFFLSVQNVLDETYKTGGFEQGRNANYHTLKEDRARALPLFGSKYWWGRGTTFFSKISLSF